MSWAAPAPPDREQPMQPQWLSDHRIPAIRPMATPGPPRLPNILFRFDSSWFLAGVYRLGRLPSSYGHFWDPRPLILEFRSNVHNVRAGTDSGAGANCIISQFPSTFQNPSPVVPQSGHVDGTPAQPCAHPRPLCDK
eukprot:gene11334-biopygen6361